jgi:hypothetical protein
MGTSATTGQRPEGFYEEWPVFCREALAGMLSQSNSTDEILAAVLLAGGAVLGAGGLAAFVEKNRKAIDLKGKEWGIPGLSDLLVGGGAVLGALLGGLGGAMVARMLTGFTNETTVNALQARLTAARREFEELKRDRAAGRLSQAEHRSAVEYLYGRLLRG